MSLIKQTLFTPTSNAEDRRIPDAVGYERDLGGVVRGAGVADGQGVQRLAVLDAVAPGVLQLRAVQEPRPRHGGRQLHGEAGVLSLRDLAALQLSADLGPGGW